MLIPNYQLIDKIAESKQTIIYKAYYKKNPGRLLSLNALKAPILSEYKIGQFRQKTEHLPFSTDDPLELIHSHLAEEAPPIHELNLMVPAVLGKIIAKLMLKALEKRYQSSSGLLADLLRCKDEYASIRTISEFPLETQIYSRRTTFISKMVGRDQEASILHLPN